MRSIIVKNNSLNQCGICHATDHWLKEMEIDGVRFLYCQKCNTITFFDDVDEMVQHKIENSMNIYYHHIKEKQCTK